MPTEREYLVSLNRDLAKPGRGRFSAEAKEVLAEARKNGMVFDKTVAEIAKEKRVAKPSKPVVVRENRPSQNLYDAKAVRSWAERNGMIEKGRRGKVPNAIVMEYLARNKSETRRVSVKVPVQRAKVREETTGWTRIKRRDKDAHYISEPLVAVSTCGDCSKSIARCGCKDGPKAPKYLGGELLLLTRPAK